MVPNKRLGSSRGSGQSTLAPETSRSRITCPDGSSEINWSGAWHAELAANCLTAARTCRWFAPLMTELTSGTRQQLP